MGVRIYPLPPLEKMRHAAVWLTTLYSTRPRKIKRTWSEALRRVPYSMECLMLIIEPPAELGWPKAPTPFWRSRTVVGDLSGRTGRIPEHIMNDFRRILLQTPPVLRNWKGGLRKTRYKRVNYNIVWEREVAHIEVA